MAPSGIESASFRLLAHCLNQLRHAMSPFQSSTLAKIFIEDLTSLDMLEFILLFSHLDATIRHTDVVSEVLNYESCVVLVG
jgi:hypothetical protein